MNKFWQIALLIGDGVLLIASLLITYALRFYVTHQEFQFIELLEPFLVVFALWILVFFIFNLYESGSINPNPKNIGRLIFAICINVLLGILFFYLFPDFGIAPKISLLFISSISFMLLVVWRRFFYTMSKKTFTRSIILIGNQKTLEQFKEKIKGHPYIREITIFQENSFIENSIAKFTEEGQQCLVVVDNYALLEKMVPVTEKYNCKIITLLTAYEDILGKMPTELLTAEEEVEIATKKESLIYVVTHAIFDRVFALSILIITSPLLLLAMIAIAIESGLPIFYKQKRAGKNGKPFTCYKLRSMVKNAEVGGAQWAEHRDTRITPVGQFLRKSHIDEIPQMWNILRGDLALIGPRPERPEFTEKLKQSIPHYNLRETIKPGFTGWAQIKFRYARTVDDSKEKFEYDLYYLRNKRILLDIGIFLKTIQVIITH